MKWEQEYSVGIAEIDEQHKILFACITEIEMAITREEKWVRGALYHLPP